MNGITKSLILRSGISRVTKDIPAKTLRDGAARLLRVRRKK